MAGQPTSVTLLQRARTGDAEAWRRLLHLYVPLVDYWCRQWGVQGADVEDVHQEVFSAVAAGLEAFQRDRPGGSFRGWLRIITHHKLVDHFRRRDHQPRPAGGSDAQRRLLQVAEAPADLDEEPAQEVNSLYRRALELVRADFEERSWQAFWRTAVDGQSPADVAAELGMSAVAARKAKSRVLRRLKDEMGDVID